MERSGDPRTEMRKATRGETIPGKTEPVPGARALWAGALQVSDLGRIILLSSTDCGTPRGAGLCACPAPPSRFPPHPPPDPGRRLVGPAQGRHRLALPARAEGFKEGAGARCQPLSGPR